MGIIRLIAAILKAVPVLGRLFLRFADFQKEKKAQVRYEEKLDRIDDAVDKYHRAGVRDSDKVEQRGEPDAAPTVPDSGERIPIVDKSGLEESGRTRVQARKKVAKRKTTNGKRKRSKTSKSGSKRIQQTKKNPKPQV
jgi:hypothetical protein